MTVREKLQQALETNDMETWIDLKSTQEAPGAGFWTGLLITGLFIAGFFTTLLTWIPAFVIWGRSMDKQQKKYLEKHREDLERRFYSQYSKLMGEKEKERKRMEMKAQGIPSCPRCLSDKVEVFGTAGAYPKMVCKLCGKVFNPGD